MGEAKRYSNVWADAIIEEGEEERRGSTRREDERIGKKRREEHIRLERMI